MNASVGKNVKFGKWPNILIRDGASLHRLVIGNNVKVDDTVYIRMRKMGWILIGNNVRLCKDVWLTAANEATLTIGEGTIIGPYNILNGGGGVYIGKRCVFSSFISVTSSDHNLKLGKPIMENGFNSKDINIWDDVLVGSHVYIKQGVSIFDHAVIGAGSVVLHDVNPRSIVAGNPAKFIKMRE